jgi:H/ACA ribonucleoprotein complex subunit 3
MSQILYCKNCKTYTLEPICTQCKKPTRLKKPARFSPQDRLGKYRRELKKTNNEI